MLVKEFSIDIDPAVISVIVDLLVGFLAGVLWLNLIAAARGAMLRVASGDLDPRHVTVLTPILRAALALAGAVFLLGRLPPPLPHPTLCAVCFAIVVAVGHWAPRRIGWWQLRPSPAAKRRAAASAAAAVTRLAALRAAPGQVRIGRMVHRLALQAGLGQAAADQLQAVAPLYDIGTIGVPERVLRAAEPLDEADRRMVQSHPLLGARILGGGIGPLHELAAEVALCHHEHWDGSGYPRGLAGTQIPLSARIVAVADLFDAMLSAAPGEPAWPLEAVIERLRLASGQLFDPALTRLFLDDLPTMLALRERAPDPARIDPGPALADAMPQAPHPVGRLLGMRSTGPAGQI